MHNNMSRKVSAYGGYDENSGFEVTGEFVFPQNGKTRPGKFLGRIWI
jgi:hypothetical protein